MGVVSEDEGCLARDDAGHAAILGEGCIGHGQLDSPVCVPCKVDADIAPVMAGDLLTTSPTPGHAQKAFDLTDTAGAIIGKALTSLASGRGDILVPMLARLPDHGRAEWTAALAAVATMPGTPTAAGLAALLRPFIRTGLISLSDLQDLLAPLARAEAATSIATDHQQGPGEDEDSRTVTTAGLCLIWPFLPRFFARLKLLNDGENAFLGEAGRHRAVLLLHHVATGERDAADFALALPKVLCGLPPQVPHHGLEPISDAEAGEAGQLLEAVIAHADCLGDISPGGFRGSFLNRDGILTTRDGAWLLRVERRTADVLLDRLPWTMQWIRQPWMQAAMRVEW
jgi:hypothetical protein